LAELSSCMRCLRQSQALAQSASSTTPQSSAWGNFVRAASFWLRAAQIYFAYKATQARHLVSWADNVFCAALCV